jgi:hypothetical protein
MVAVFANEHTPRANNSNAATVGAHKSAPKAAAAAFGADSSNLGAIVVPQHLHAMIAVVSYNDVPGAVKGKAKRG